MALHTGQKPVIQQGWLRAALCLVAYLGLAYIAFPLAGVSPQAAVTEQLPIALLTRVLLVHALLVVGMVLLFRVLADGRPLRSLGLHWRGREALTGSLAALLIVGGGTLLLWLNGLLHFSRSTTATAPLLAAIGLLLLTSFSEELFFRGYFLDNLLQSMPAVPALALSAALFAGMHMGNDHIHWIAIVNLFACGLLLGLNFCYTRNCWYSIALHCCWNILEGPVLGYEVSGLRLPAFWRQEQSGSPILTGGPFGFEGSILNSLLTAALFLLLYRLYRRWYGPHRLISSF
ncbi:MAG: type II CAAX endopeptidase family protein [Candidatus Pseudobacter hemicellulosilyticus]|uniref:Type II CAAX endopeptidase family protein n=1 Tax=Candidatus Pseudobacter hemicellulosilyticus TaxID=3121375 RepID=A0AAJ6BF75_9BACT|nr:MAG: type II CAAX endopeptidase family protein [Pseudobacter sp.]